MSVCNFSHPSNANLILTRMKIRAEKVKDYTAEIVEAVAGQLAFERPFSSIGAVRRLVETHQSVEVVQLTATSVSADQSLSDLSAAVARATKKTMAQAKQIAKDYLEERTGGNCVEETLVLFYLIRDLVRAPGADGTLLALHYPFLHREVMESMKARTDRMGAQAAEEFACAVCFLKDGNCLKVVETKHSSGQRTEHTALQIRITQPSIKIPGWPKGDVLGILDLDLSQKVLWMDQSTVNRTQEGVRRLRFHESDTFSQYFFGSVLNRESGVEVFRARVMSSLYTIRYITANHSLNRFCRAATHVGYSYVRLCRS